VYRREVFPLDQENVFMTEQDRELYEISCANKLKQRQLAKTTSSINIMCMFIAYALGEAKTREKNGLWC